MAVNVTEVPVQIAPDGTAAILTLAGRFGFTTIVMALLVNGFPTTQSALEVSLHVTTCPLVNTAEV